MCFYIHRDHPTEKTATKNIVCYKRLEPFVDKNGKDEKYLISPFQSFKYEKGCHYEYDKKLNVSRDSGDWSAEIINKGLHSYATKEMAVSDSTWNEVCIKCIIPKGTKYYYNPSDEEYVSNELIIGKRPIKL